MQVLGVAGWSGSGKTTLITRLIGILVGYGITVSTIKHAHHEFDIDKKERTLLSTEWLGLMKSWWVLPNDGH